MITHLGKFCPELFQLHDFLLAILAIHIFPKGIIWAILIHVSFWGGGGEYALKLRAPIPAF